MRRSDVSQLRADVRSSRFTVVEEEDITANVRLALERDSARRRALIEARVAAPLRRRALALAAVEGTPLYAGFATGELTYLRFALQKGP